MALLTVGGTTADEPAPDHPLAGAGVLQDTIVPLVSGQGRQHPRSTPLSPRDGDASVAAGCKGLIKMAGPRQPNG